MPTILELAAAGELEKIDPDLDPDELEERSIYVLAGGEVRLQKLLGTMQSQWNTEVSPAEQMDELVYNFSTGEILDYPRLFRDLKHHRKGIWELKAPDLRLFGFFANKDCFICTDVADANIVKQYGYSGYIEQGAFRREKLDLNEPKFIDSKRPEDVVSNCYLS